MHLLDAMCLVTCKDENDELIKEYKLHIKKRGTRFRISGVNKYTKLNVEVDVLTADFKKYYYNGEFRRKVTKKGVSCKFLTLRGFEKATTLFGVAVLAISAFSIYKYLDLRNVNVSLQNYEFVEEGNSYAVESFSGEVSKLVLPSSYNGKPVNRVNGLAFYNVSFNEPSYDDGDYEIGGSIVTPDVDGKAALAIDEVYFSKPSDGSGYYHGADGSDGYKYSDGSGYFNDADGSSSRYDSSDDYDDDDYSSYDSDDDSSDLASSLVGLA